MTTLAFDIFWRDHGAARGAKDLGENARKASGHVQTLGSHGKTLAAGFAGFAAAEIFRSFISGARESNLISRVTEQRIRSTGGAAHVTADQVGDLATAISNKTGADDEAIQSGENMLLTFCLEESAQALTRRGWVGQSDLRAGDEILAYDPEDGTVRWEPVDSVHRFAVDGELVRWQSKQIDVLSTPTHRWWTVGQNDRASFRPQFRTTEQISGKQIRVKIGGGQPECFAGEPAWTDELVELAGWVVTEGWVDWQRPSTPTRNGVHFCQSETANPDKVKRIRLLVDRLRMQGHRISETQQTAPYNGSTVISWHMGRDLGATLREMLPGKKLTPDLLTALTRQQASLLLDVLIEADGHTDGHGHRQYIQKDRGQLDVVAMLAAMLGIRTTDVPSRSSAGSLYLNSTNHAYGHALNARPEHYQGIVWCPHLRTGVWLARVRGRTFWTGNTAVRNEVGKGNDVFNQATQAATDLAAGLNQGQVTAEGTEKASIMLGKALQDPIAGMTALRRVGISFTQSQVEQITALQKSGHTLEAQKVILGEVNKEFGGTARAAADPLQRLSVILGNISEDIGNKLLPALNTGADVMAAIPGPVYVAGAAFVALGAGAIGVSKAVNAVRDISQGTAGVMRLLGIRTAEVAAAETAQATAAGRSAVATAASGDAAAAAGTKFGALAGKLALGGAVVGLAALSNEITGWQGRSSVATVSTDKLAASILEMQRTGRATGAVFDVANISSMRYKAHIDTSAEAMQRFAEEAQGAFGMSFTDVIGRAQDGANRLEAFSKTAGQLDSALASMVQSGHAKEAQAFFEDLRRRTGLTDDEFQHVINRLPQYTAAMGGATQATKSGAGAQRDAAAASAAAKAAFDLEITALGKLSDQTLGLRAGDRDLRGAQDDLTASIRTNGRTLSINTAAGRANGDALDRVARLTRDNLQAHRDAGEPLRQYAGRVKDATSKLADEAVKAGMSKTAARKYAEAILAVPRKQTTAYTTPGLAAARSGARGLAADLKHIESRKVNVQVNAAGTIVSFTQGSRRGAAAGGPVTGWSPTSTADNLPYMLTAGEHVWSVAETKGAGGHERVAQLRGMARAGKLAAGGPVERYAQQVYLSHFPPQGTLERNVDARVIKYLNATGFGGGGGPIPGGSGVARWGPMMHRALAALGLPQSLWPNEMRQIATESGGNPNAVQGNIGDVNNRSGDLAKGLLQIIGATYRAYHWPGTAWNVFDPWSNMTTSLNYQKHRYPGRIAQVIGHGHGYDAGGVARGRGWIPKPTSAPERVLSPRQTVAFERLVPMLTRTGGASTVVVQLQLTGHAIGFQDQIVDAVKGAVRSGRLSRAVMPGAR